MSSNPAKSQALCVRSHFTHTNSAGGVLSPLTGEKTKNQRGEITHFRPQVCPCVICERSVASDLDASLSASKALHHRQDTADTCTRLGLTAQSVPCSSQSLARLNKVGKLKKKKNSGINALLCMGSQRAMKCAPMEKSLVHAQSLGGSICSEGR